MRILANLGPKTLAASLLAGLVVGWSAWVLLPPMPRVSIPSQNRIGRTAFSRDCRYFACAEGTTTGRREWQGELRVWDTHQRRLLFTAPYAEVYPPTMDGGYSFAFTPTADKLVCFGWGKAKYFTIPSGKDWEPAVAHLFPSDNADQCSSRLVSGQTGDLFVLIHDYKKKTIAIRDLETGREVSSWESQFVPEICTGGIVEWSGVHQRLREIPSGKQRQSLQSKVHLAGSLLMEYHVCTPDCRTLLVVDGAIRKCTDGIETKLDLPAHQFPAISPDGRLLAVLVHQAQSYDGMSRWLSKLGLMHRDAVFVIYDLTTATEIARVPNVTYAHFAQDGQTLALFKDDAVELYDLPLNSPWDWIATAAMVAAGFVFLVGQWMRCRRKSKPNRPMKHGPDETKCG